MKKTGKIVVVGSSNTDLVISAQHFPQPGETIIGHGFMSNQGGKGANQAVAAARLGGCVSFVAKLGMDSNATETLKSLHAEGIDTKYVSQTAESPSGVAVITTDSTGENTIVVESGANALFLPQDIDNAEAVFQEAAIVLMQMETPVPTLIRAAEYGKRNGALVVLNPAPMPAEGLPSELLEKVDLLIPNEGEMEMLTGISLSDLSQVSEAIRCVQEKGVKDVLVTVGARGVYMLAQDGSGAVENIPAFPVQAVDTTAAGDTFCGALCVALCESRPVSDAIRFACRASSISVSRRGAQMSMPKREEIE